MSNENTDVEFIDPQEIVKFLPNEKVFDDRQPAAAKVSKPSMEYANKIEEKASEYVIKKQEDVRSNLAVIYVIGTFIIFLLGFAVAVFDAVNRNVSVIDNLKEILTLLSGIFLGTLGFVLGYYFKKGEGK